jgi:NTP pyrophosphatase (non-canonical NTP hydrolase)
LCFHEPGLAIADLVDNYGAEMGAKTFSLLATIGREVVREADWELYHTPENITLFLLGEVGEVGEYCQWLSKEALEAQGLLEDVTEEIADVIKNVLFLANVLPLHVSLERLIVRKLELDKEAYPVSLFKGKSRYEVEEEERRKQGVPALPEDELDELPTLEDLQSRAWSFVRERDWQQYYGAANLALALAVKSGEVATTYQRRAGEPTESPYETMIWALADILLTALRLCSYLDVENTYDLVLAKLEKDRERFA